MSSIFSSDSQAYLKKFFLITTCMVMSGFKSIYKHIVGDTIKLIN